MEETKLSEQEIATMVEEKGIDILANWWLRPRFVADTLGYKEALHKFEDWQIIHKTELFEVAWDYEEGIKLRGKATKEVLDAMLKLVAEIHEKHSIPYKVSGRKHFEGFIFMVGLNWVLHESLNDIFRNNTGLEHIEEYSRLWGYAGSKEREEKVKAFEEKYGRTPEENKVYYELQREFEGVKTLLDTIQLRAHVKLAGYELQSKRNGNKVKLIVECKDKPKRVTIHYASGDKGEMDIAKMYWYLKITKK